MNSINPTNPMNTINAIDAMNPTNPINALTPHPLRLTPYCSDYSQGGEFGSPPETPIGMALPTNEGFPSLLTPYPLRTYPHFCSARMRFIFPSSPANTTKNFKGVFPLLKPLCHVLTTSRNAFPASISCLEPSCTSTVSVPERT